MRPLIRRSRFITLCISLLLVSSVSAPLGAMAAEVQASSIENFVDGVMEAAIVDGQTVGATVSMVQNGRLVLARGYGLADLSTQTPVQSRLTQFRIGSITKVLVWISVLQLVEAGKLDLDTNINEYLRAFSISKDFSDAVTLRHLMTHTPGFEDDLSNLFVTGPRQLGNLVDFLAEHQPRRVRLPGTQVAYSNYGVALAGHIVSEVSGMSWHDYVHQNVLTPLGMIDATTRQPPPREIEVTRSRGYIARGDGYAEQGFSYIPLAPAGSASATALDMARLMVELLNSSGTGILSAASKAQMLNGAFKSHPDLPGLTLGMYQMGRDSAPAVGHDGSTMLFNSRMILWPDAEIGLFVSTNTDTGANLVQTLSNTIARHIGLNTSRLPVSEDGISGGRYASDYITTRRNFSNHTKIMALMDVVSVDFDLGQSVLHVTRNGVAQRYKQVSDSVFQREFGDEVIGFVDQGRGEYSLHFASAPMVSYSPATRVQTLPFNLLLIACFVLFSLSVIVFWPVSSFVHRGYSNSPGQVIVLIMQGLTIGLSVLFFLQLVGLGDNAYALVNGGLKAMKALLWLPFAISILVLLQVFYIYRVWVNAYWWLSRRLHFTLVLLADCALVWWFWYWNLIPAQVLALVGVA